MSLILIVGNEKKNMCKNLVRMEEKDDLEFSLFQQFFLEEKKGDEIRQYTITAEDILNKYNKGDLKADDIISVPLSFDEADESTFIKINNITSDRIYLSYCHVNHMLDQERKKETEIEKFRRLGYPNELHKGYILI